MHKTWSITFENKIQKLENFVFEDNFGNLGDNLVNFFFGQNSMGKPFLGSDFDFAIPNLVLSWDVTFTAESENTKKT